MRENRSRDATASGRDFVVLWIGQTFSVFGSAVSLLALPTVAILSLHAGALQLGILEALAYAAFPTLGLVVGVFADRMPRRRIMLAADAVRAVALGSIPVAAVAHVLGRARIRVSSLRVRRRSSRATVWPVCSLQRSMPRSPSASMR